MLTAALVQASVVDLRQPASVLPARVVADANVLYWQFYTNFPSLRYAGGRLPLAHQLAEYPHFWRRAAQAGTTFHSTAVTLGEFTRTAEYAELEAIWLTD